MAQVSSSAIEELKTAIRGRWYCPTIPVSTNARSIWNAMIDCRPAMILRCAGVADVRRGIAFARANDLPLALRGGGHRHCRQRAMRRRSRDGLLADEVRANRSDRKTRVCGTGRNARGLRSRSASLRTCNTTRHQFDHGCRGPDARRRLRLAQPQIRHDDRQSDFSRRGHRRRRIASRQRRIERRSVLGDSWRRQHFGVVTSFEFALHSVGPMVYGGLVVLPFAEARDALVNIARPPRRCPTT